MAAPSSLDALPDKSEDSSSSQSDGVRTPCGREMRARPALIDPYTRECIRS